MFEYLTFLGQSENIQLTRLFWEGLARNGTTHAAEPTPRRHSHPLATEATPLAAASNTYDMLVVILRNNTLQIDEITKALVVELRRFSVNGECWEILLSNTITTRNITLGAFNAAAYFGNSALIDKIVTSGCTVPHNKVKNRSFLRAAIEGGIAPVVHTFVHDGVDTTSIDEHG